VANVQTSHPLEDSAFHGAPRVKLHGQGILLRSQWDVARHLRSRRLRAVLPQWKLPPADIYALYPT
jgi:DNA-binding transcriptional LysR family regulator